MSEKYHIECLVSSLTAALQHARMACMDIHFTSEIDHLINTAIHNRDAEDADKESVNV